ncbi:hypothetical protein F5X68DRAFT_187240 [Plectosphaerella plurivora]|uniref:Bacteriophage T5 Orf172 DNA-binding domain-containing protein n=1 Tax=Plectosphaerella plurivora TaxID=936078 RepID=A0A9P9AG87_9PEZI|nr:hypothetical protein F5X68DRAFT_187240 [Plectosphaerella plurivora]
MSPSPLAAIQPTPPPTPRLILSTIVAATNAPASGPHTFAPYIKVRSLVDIDTDIRDLLLAGLDPKDTGRSGWVYGFRFPAAYTITALPKPYSAHDSPDAVARQHRGVFRVPTRYYLLVEGLVHLELDGTRRRETVPCPKCQVRHIEWFEVDAAVARHKVEAWRDWVGREPFEGRVLKKEWVARLRMVKIGQEG